MSTQSSPLAQSTPEWVFRTENATQAAVTSIHEEVAQKAEELTQKNAALLEASQELLAVRQRLVQLLENVNHTLYDELTNVRILFVQTMIYTPNLRNDYCTARGRHF